MIIKTGIKSENFKYSPGTGQEPFNSKMISLKCIRNSFAAFQLLVECDESCTISMGDAPAFTIYPERKIVRISAESKGIGPISVSNITLLADDNGTLRADCIENKDYLHVNANTPAVFWCESPVNTDISPGFYTATVNLYVRKLFEKEILKESLNINLEILDVTIPDAKDYSMHLDLWQHLSNIARKHDVRLFSQSHFKVIEKYVESLARLGQKAITVIASEIPWSGQRTFNDLDTPTDLFEYNMVSVKKNKAGLYEYDYSVMDRYIKLCMSMGIDGIIEVFGLCGIWMTEENGFGKAADDFPDGVRIRYYDETETTYSYMDDAMGIRDYIKSLYRHFIQNGWLEKVRITADEPGDIELYRKTINVILEEGPAFQFSISINKAEFTTEFDSIMSDATPSLRCLANDYDFIRENLINRDDKKVCWYVCCRPHYPNTFLKSHLLESRFICILTSLLNLDGFLRWNYTVWPENPRQDLLFRSPGWLAGDMNFVYPGNNGSPLLSLRYKALLRGIEDFELMTMAKNKNLCPTEEIYELLLGNTTLQQLSDLGYNEDEPDKPFSTKGSDYSTIREMLYNVL